MWGNAKPTNNVAIRPPAAPYPAVRENPPAVHRSRPESEVARLAIPDPKDIAATSVPPAEGAISLAKAWKATQPASSPTVIRNESPTAKVKPGE